MIAFREMGRRVMTEQRLVSAAIRIIGLWRIFYQGGGALYYILGRQLGITTSTLVPLATGWFNLIYEVVFGVIIVLAAPFIAQAIFGTKPSQS
jgi:hypothetical protein